MQGIPGTFPTEIVSQYAIERELGRGGTAVVYLARNLATGREVALKVLRGELSESLTADRFLREIRLTQELSHPNIVPVLDSGLAGGTLYCVLEYLDGGTLRARLDRDRQLPLPEVAAIAGAIGAALEYAHARKIIHRDVKPENILFGSGYAALADFGIARALEHAGDTTTSTGIVRGTPAYMSPEQASGERDYDGRSDVYSLACVLYEAIAGMPAFVGPNPQAILAQRLVHVPRPLRVYRPAASAELEAVLVRALAVAPADRYQTAGEFTTALRSAIETPSATFETPAVAASRRSRRWLWTAGLTAVAAAAMLLGPLKARMPWAALAPLDTTRIAVFPMQGASAGTDLLFAGFQRWQGLTLVDRLTLAQEIRGQEPVDPRGAARIAERLGAGRYVLARIDSAATGRTLYGTLYDVRRAALHHVQQPLAADGAMIPGAFAALADSLLLRGAVDEAPDASGPGTRDLVSTQLMIAGQAKLRDWDLEMAESLLARASQRDPASGRSFFWLAQVREWAGRSMVEWLPAAQVARGKLATLNPTEQVMAAALVDLGGGDYAGACQQYQSLVDRDRESFAGWYGLGECHSKDLVVVRDRNTRYGWRYRSSYQPALDAYVTAFRLLPATYRGFQANAYDRLRALLYVSARRLRRGISEGPGSVAFYASPVLDGDTIVFVPTPLQASTSGTPLVTMTQVSAAVAHLREIFRTVTSNWARAAPTSPGAKEAIAISLELAGDPAAIDSLAVAQRLATEPLQRLRLATMRAYVRLKVSVPEPGLPFDSAGLASARRLADSLLAAPHAPTPEASQLLAPMAALAGRCASLRDLLRLASTKAPDVQGVPAYVAEDAALTLALGTLGCAIPATIPPLDVLAARMTTPGAPADAVLRRQYDVLGGIVRSRFPLDSTWIDRLAPTGDYLIAAQHDFLLGDRGGVGRRLGPIAERRKGFLPGDLTPDAVWPEARLWLLVGDTAAASRALHSTIDFSRNFPPMDWSETLQNVVTIASLVRAMALNAELPTAEPGGARRWAAAVALLWAGADPELQPLVRQMRATASR